MWVRGLDINSSYTIYDLINEQKKKGVAVIFVGEDLDVLMELSDRIMVLCGGEVSGILDAKERQTKMRSVMRTREGRKRHEEEPLQKSAIPRDLYQGSASLFTI